MPDIFGGEPICEIDPDGAAGCRFVQEKQFRALLGPVILYLIAKSPQRGFRGLQRNAPES